jgi:hypothetical protein
VTKVRGIGAAAGGAVLTAAASTLGDWLWATTLPHHRPAFGVAHGALLFLVVGLYLGAVARRPGAGAVGGALIGFLAAGSFYLLQPAIGYAALFVLWIALWAALGLLNGRVLERRATMREALARSALAAVGSGLAFYAISGIWFPFDPRGWDYGVHFVSWTVAYLPAFLAFLVRRPARVA